MSEHHDIVCLKVIYDSIEKIEKFTKDNTYDDFYNDDKTIDSVLMNLIVIGEEANKLTEEFKDAHEEIDWYRIRGFRNRIAHDYGGTNLKIVWQILTINIPELKTYLEKII